MKIGIFGGTFNPVHKGHLLVANYAFKILKLDKLIFVPAFQNPFKNQETNVSIEHRVNMLKLVLNPPFEISNFEINRQSISHSIETVRYFKNKFPQAEIYYLLGSDNVKKLHKWKAIAELASLVQITIFKRDKFFNHPNFKKYHCLLLNNSLFKYSSSEYKQGNLSVVETVVQDYIGKNKLYLYDFLKNWLSSPRFKHSLATAKLAQEYARHLNFNVEKAFWAGLLHDLTKKWPQQKHHDFLNKINVSSQDFESHELHGLTASLWLSNCYKIDDQAICQAIKVHTVLDLNLTILDQIVYAADKLCQGRKWPGIQSLRKQMFTNFQTGFKQLVELVYLKVLKEHQKINISQVKIYEKWSK